MKHILQSFLLATITFLNPGLYSQTLLGGKLKTTLSAPSLSASCQGHGDKGLETTRVYSSIERDRLHLKIFNRLHICALKNNSVDQFQWKVVNPYKGYRQVVYSPKTQNLELRFDQIDPMNPQNFFELRVYFKDSKHLYRSNMSESTGAEFFGHFDLLVDEIFTPDELDRLNHGQTVRKKVLTFHRSNVTSTLLNVKYETFDEIWASRELTIDFTKLDR